MVSNHGMVSLSIYIICSYIMLYGLRRREWDLTCMSETTVVEFCASFGRLLQNMCFDLLGVAMHIEWSWDDDSANVHYSLIHHVVSPQKERTGSFHQCQRREPRNVVHDSAVSCGNFCFDRLGVVVHFE